MEEQTQSAPTLCRNGCGYYGSSATEGMCSQCFRDYQRRKQEKTTQSSATSPSASPGSSNAGETLAVSSSSPSRSSNTLEEGLDYSDGELVSVLRYCYFICVKSLLALVMFSCLCRICNMKPGVNSGVVKVLVIIPIVVVCLVSLFCVVT